VEGAVLAIVIVPVKYACGLCQNGLTVEKTHQISDTGKIGTH